MSATYDTTVHAPAQSLGDRLCVEMGSTKNQTTASGLIHIPETAKDEPQWGTVLSVGPLFQAETFKIDPDNFHPDMIVVKGDRVLLARYGGNRIELPDGRSLVYVREDDVLAKLPPAGAMADYEIVELDGSVFPGPKRAR